jgi:DNA/RNA-binding domain of Phe-tRNA-synthetase-like protein
MAEEPVLQAYKRYYKAFGQNYHVQMQVESILLKGKPLAAGAALVESMFAAEVKNMLLTAGHDAAAVQTPVTVDVAKGGEEYEVFAGRVRALKAGDMYMRDGAGIMSSVLYGPDQRTKMTGATARVLFAVYAPPGVGGAGVRAHLDEIASNVRLVAPGAQVEVVEVLEA